MKKGLLSSLGRRLPSAIDLRDLIRQEAGRVLREVGATGFAKATVDSGYASGNPKIAKGWESAAPSSGKTLLQIQPFGNRFAAIAASDSVAYGYDKRNSTVAGKLVSAGSSITDAEYIMGLRPVTPGNTTLASANTQQSTTSSTYVKLKEFFATRPGRYRVTADLSRTGGTTQMIVRLLRPDGTTVDASTAGSYSGTVFPTFGSVSVDMTVTAWWGAQISVWLLNTLGSAQTGYIQNCVLKYADATASMSPYDVVILD